MTYYYVMRGCCMCYCIVCSCCTCVPHHVHVVAGGPIPSCTWLLVCPCVYYACVCSLSSGFIYVPFPSLRDCWSVSCCLRGDWSVPVCVSVPLSPGGAGCWSVPCALPPLLLSHSLFLSLFLSVSHSSYLSSLYVFCFFFLSFFSPVALLMCLA